MGVHNVIPKPQTLEAMRFTGGSEQANEIEHWLEKHNYLVHYLGPREAVYSRGDSCQEVLSPARDEEVYIRSRNQWSDFQLHVQVGQWVVLDLDKTIPFLVDHDVFETDFIQDPRPAPTRWNYARQEPK